MTNKSGLNAMEVRNTPVYTYNLYEQVQNNNLTPTAN